MRRPGGHEDDRRGAVHRAQAVGEGETVDFAHHHVGDDAIGGRGGVGVEQLRGIEERLGREAGAFQQSGKRRAEVGVVVDDVNDRARRIGQSLGSPAKGKFEDEADALGCGPFLVNRAAVRRGNRAGDDQADAHPGAQFAAQAYCHSRSRRARGRR